MRRPLQLNREAMISWMGECVTLVRSLKKTWHDLCFDVLGLSLKNLVYNHVHKVVNYKKTSFIGVCRDVDDPEYKPAPALLKDDMEVRQHEPKAHDVF